MKASVPAGHSPRPFRPTPPCPLPSLLVSRSSRSFSPPPRCPSPLPSSTFPVVSRCRRRGLEESSEPSSSPGRVGQASPTWSHHVSHGPAAASTVFTPVSLLPPPFRHHFDPRPSPPRDPPCAPSGSPPRPGAGPQRHGPPGPPEDPGVPLRGALPGRARHRRGGIPRQPAPLHHGEHRGRGVDDRRRRGDMDQRGRRVPGRGLHRSRGGGAGRPQRHLCGHGLRRDPGQREHRPGRVALHGPG
jgi:hypothetical protein